MDTFLEILKTTIPALVVFFTVFYMMKQFVNSQYQLKLLEIKHSEGKTVLPLRLQAYERLSLLCERMTIPSLIMRLRTQESSAPALQYAMMLTVQQEFEHNLTQQVYVSENLWEILKLSKDDTLNTIAVVAASLPKDAGPDVLIDALFEYINTHHSALQTALLAIKNEASVLYK
jgi:hypothetical protein